LQQLGFIVAPGTPIPYIICEGDEHYTERALHPDMLKRIPDMKPDMQWYLQTQIIPPLSRLVEVLPSSTQHAAQAMIDNIIKVI
jgi:DNA polymerase elongation subunit (family B)